MRVDAIAFDLDGTLIDSNDAWHSGLNKTLKLYGKDERVTKKFFIENHVGVEQKQHRSSRETDEWLRSLKL